MSPDQHNRIVEEYMRDLIESGGPITNGQARFLIARLDEKWADCKMLAEELTREQDRRWFGSWNGWKRRLAREGWHGREVLGTVRRRPVS